MADIDITPLLPLYLRLGVMGGLLAVCQRFDPQLDGLYCQACGRLRLSFGQLVSRQTLMQRASELDDRLVRLIAASKH